MKVFIACLGTETNTFSPIPTGEETFVETMFYDGDATQHEQNLFSEPLHVWRRKTEAHQGVVVESLAAFAQPAGITVRGVYEGYRDRILADLEAALPVDVVLLCMHGAMVAEGYPDCEGDLLECARGVAGSDAVLGAELDLHCSVTKKMLAAADVIVTFKEYPHIDGGARAAELFDICTAKHQGTANPVMEVYDTRMINMWRTPVEPMKSVVADMQAREGKDGVLSVSFAHGFPWGDVPEASAKMLVIADGDRPKAAAVAKSFGERIWDLREETQASTHSIDEALDEAAQIAEGPIVLADISDNAGGGAPSDSTFILREMIRRKMSNAMNGLYWDPVATRFCFEAGEGATFDLRVGGKCGLASGDPLDLRVTVRKLLRDAGQTFGSSRNRMGDAAWVTTDGGIDLVLNSVRTQVFHPDAFTQLGLDPAERNIVVVKSTQHFYAGFAPLARKVLYVAAPGAIPPDFAAIPFENFTDPYWPRVANPFGA